MNSLKTVSISSNYEYQGVIVECDTFNMKNIRWKVDVHNVLYDDFATISKGMKRPLKLEKKQALNSLLHLITYIQTLLLQ